MYKVVLADDEIWMNIGLKKQIEDIDLPFVVVGEANDGISALDEVKEKQADVLFSDIRMPGMDGIHILEKLQQEKIDTKCVLVSGYADFKYAQEAVRYNAYDYLLKPVKQEDLERVLQNLQKAFLSENKAGNQDGLDGASAMYEQSTLDCILKLIQESYTENLTLTAISKEYLISVPRLSTLLKERLGIPFSEYLAIRRVQKAKELLKNEKLSVDEVADMVGYHDYSYFIRVFKKVTGISPSQYRKKML